MKHIFGFLLILILATSCGDEETECVLTDHTLRVTYITGQADTLTVYAPTHAQFTIGSEDGSYWLACNFKRVCTSYADQTRNEGFITYRNQSGGDKTRQIRFPGIIKYKLL